MISLLARTKLVFYSEAEGYYNDAGEWVGGDLSTTSLKGSLQSFRRNTKQLLLPDGISSSDARVFFTTTKLKSSDEFGDTQADYTVINGREFYVKEVEDNTGYGLMADHYKCLLIRRDK